MVYWYESILLCITSCLIRIYAIDPSCECVVFQSYGLSKGTFQSPNYPKAYKTGINCVLYSFIGDLTELVQIKFIHMNLGPRARDGGCKDRLRIYRKLDRPVVNEHSLQDEEICGDRKDNDQLTFFSIDRALVLEFHTDLYLNSNKSYNGFKGEYAFLNKGSFITPGLIPGTLCKHNIQSSRNATKGKLFSPRFPLKYPRLANCEYLFSGLEKQIVVVTFIHISLPSKRGKSCSNAGDRITVYDGIDNNSKQLGTFCDNDNNRSVRSSGPYMFIEFTSDQRHEKQGFDAEFEFTNSKENPDHTASPSDRETCGKTTFVKTLLQKHIDRIQPGIRRIVYLYKRWQPLYDVIKSTVVPRVEFIRGIPTDLDDDDYFDPSVNNLLILDDIHSEAGKDKRITGLFTEGSHHRSLSVISINQNLYGVKDPTQKRNTQYMVLYNNPVDSQCTLTLARQMYPGNAEKFTKLFAKATKQPYRFFFLDLKPTTPESRRLQPHVVWPDDPKPARIGQTHVPNTEASRIIPDADAPSGDINPIVKNVSDHSREVTPSVQLSSIQNELNTMLSCDDCGVVFEHHHDLQHHVKHRCPEREDRSDEPPRKRMKFDFEEGHEPFDYPDEENAVYKKLARYAMEHNEDERRRKVVKYEKKGLSSKMATAKANRALREEDVRAFLLKYAGLLSFFFQLKNGYLHDKIMNTIEKYLERDMDLKKAIRLSLKKYKHHFEEIVEQKDDDVNDDDTSDEEENSGEDDSDVEEGE